MSLSELIPATIRTSGPISIAEYMALCLSHHEYGYYMKRDPFGAQGDFITAPEISQVFGELLGLWLVAQWEKLGKPKATLAEFGPGRGTLMADLLRGTKKISGFHDAMSVRLLEISPSLKQKQWNTLAGKHHDIEWLDSPDALPEQPLFLIANEFLDALPIRQFIHQDGRWQERMVGMEEDKLIFTTSNDVPEAIQSTAADKDGAIIETCEPAIEITTFIAEHIAKHGGASLFIDYGYTQGSKGDSLQAMKQHHYHEILDNPGDADLTAHVDFAAIAETAKASGAAVYGPTPQGKFLMKIGAGQRVQTLCATATPEQGIDLVSGLERLASPDKMGDLFKVLAITSDNIKHAEGF